MRVVLLAGLASGCGYSSTWPDYPDHWLDTASGTPLPPSLTVPCVPSGGQPLTLTVVSTVGATLWLSTVTPPELGCYEQLYATLSGYQEITVEVSDELVWTVRDQGSQLLDVFQVPAGAGTWTEPIP